ncbi:MAG: aminoglycoside 6-N-acetyltransferase [Gaiellales bacterium]|nr:aminoglycoside 6-N-acetyltransferase [Gaiellales bacterium]MDX6545957.1 aminoglycoside 6-N-acetyltransferase [Gaiellales bacterium]
MILRGERLLLRPLGDGDIDRVAQIAAEPEVALWWGDLPRQELIDKVAGGDVVAMAIERDGAVIGLIQFSEERDPMYRHAGIDLFLSSSEQGLGLGREAVSLIVSHLFGDLGHHRITIDPAAANRRAIRCYSAVGFRPVGVMRRYERGPDGSFHDGLLMELLREHQ